MTQEYLAQYGLTQAQLPRHVGIIMDGNGRWATARKLPRLAGHRKGVERVQEITELSGNLGIEALTLYAFSDENWCRPEEEVSGLMGLLRWYLHAEKKRIIRNNVRFRMMGDRLKLSQDILAQITDLEKVTEHNTGLHLSVALSYGGRGEIIRAVKKIVQQIQVGEAFLSDLDEHFMERHLDTAGLPPVDLVIRTSGEMRISNFLLWQMAYAEMVFEQALWPDFSTEVLMKILQHFASRERRFGRTPEQIRNSRRGAQSGQ